MPFCVEILSPRYYYVLPVRSGPSIVSVTSRKSKPGGQATLHGDGFSPSVKKKKVYFGRKMARVRRASWTSLKVTIPNGLKKGPVDVKAVVNGMESNTVQFVVK